MNLKTIERGEVKKDIPIAGETRIDDVAIITNYCAKRKYENSFMENYRIGNGTGPRHVP